MVAIDVNLKAKSLGIEYDAYHGAEVRLNELLWELGEECTIDQYLAAIKSLPHDQLVAEIRWNHLDRRFPDEFDWNGVKEARPA